ncbi:MAG: hypothetical protein RL113_268 [Pseudomonadota bacterium]
MQKTVRYFIVTFILILSALFYLFYIPLGNQQLYTAISYLASKKTDLNIHVNNLNIRRYPYFSAQMVLEDRYHLTIRGIIENDHLNLKYTLQSDTIQNGEYAIDDHVNITGDVTGLVSNAKITGKGDALQGNVNYTVFKTAAQLENIDANLTDINTSKLFALLGQTPFASGKGDAQIFFDHIAAGSKKGHIDYAMHQNNFHGLIGDLDAKIVVENEHYTFTGDMVSPDATLHLTKGKFDETTQKLHSFYTLDLKELNTLHPNYHGALNAFGEISYDKKLSVTGLSKSLGGLVELRYGEDKIAIDLSDVPMERIAQKLSMASTPDTNLSGQIVYLLSQKEAKASLNLGNLKLPPLPLIKTLSEKSDINLTEEIFDQSKLDLTYHDNLLEGMIHIGNDTHHIHFNNTKINLPKMTLDTMLDFKVNGYTIAGQTHLAKLESQKPKEETDDVYVKFNGALNTYYRITLNGLLNDKWANMDYTLEAERFPSHICTIEDNVILSGHINGPFTRLHIMGEGELLNGLVTFSATKVDNGLENLSVEMQKIHSLKLSTLLGQNTFPMGRADISAHFKHLGQENKEGQLIYTLPKSTLDNLPFTLQTQIDVKDNQQHFFANVTLDNAELNITKGYRDTDANLTSAFFVLNVKELATMQTLLGYGYRGPLYVMGEATYQNGFQAKGLSKTFGGMSDFVLENNQLNIHLSDVSFERFMHLFPVPKLLDAVARGDIVYDFTKKQMTVNTVLEKAKFLPSDLVSSLYNKANVNLLVEEFNDSTLVARYENDILTGDLQLSNEKSHFSLTNTVMQPSQNRISGNFDIKMQEEEFSGKLFGALNNPEIDLNMQKLIKHKMDEQMDSMVGKSNREMMESMPMGDTAKDAVSGAAGAFMKMFF